MIPRKKRYTSAMLPFAIEAKNLADGWTATYHETGELDAKAIDAMADARRKITLGKPSTDLDLLLTVGAAQSVAAFGWQAINGETELEMESIETLTASFYEAAYALQTVRKYLETKQGVALADMGLFGDRVALQ
jgi:hypothetical protein